MTIRVRALPGLALAAALLSTLASTGARADDVTACVDAASKGQNLRDEHKLIEAREQFRQCARRGCPAVVQKDCAGWLDGVERSLPTVVVTARDRTGATLFDVRVMVDGQLLVSNLDGQAVPMNPGMHAFRFDGPAGTRVDRQVLVTEGLRNQVVPVVLGAPVVAVAPPVPKGGSEWRTVGWVLGGLGVVGLGVGAAFGAAAIGDKSGAHCDANDFCDGSSLGSARDAARLSDIGLVAGGCLLLGGGALLLWSSRGGSSGEGIRAAPMVSSRAGGLVVGGGF